MSDCLFCKIVNGEVPSSKVYEDEQVLAFLDINPNNPGHTLLIPKEHYPDYDNTPDEVLADLMVKVKKVASAVKKAMAAPAYNIAVNVGEVAGQAIPHTHIHIIPRFENDGLKHWPHRPYQEGEQERVAEKIRQAF